MRKSFKSDSERDLPCSNSGRKYATISPCFVESYSASQYGTVPDMASADEVKKLASLARISIPEEQTEKFAKEFEGILAYVGALDTLSLQEDSTHTVGEIHTVFRRDGEPHETGMFTEKLVEAFPEKKDNYLLVKQIITHGQGT